MVIDFIQCLGRRLIRARTVQALRLDSLRLRARMKHPAQSVVPSHALLHLGCGRRRVPSFLNVDLIHSDYDIDLASGKLPWVDAAFDAVVSQHVIEHLDLATELPDLLAELLRVLRPGGELWLSCPDMERVCRAYLTDAGASLLRSRLKRYPKFSIGPMPTQQMVNDLFHQQGQHLNLFDYSLLAWLLESQGFARPERVMEADLLRRFPGFPLRDDDEISLYVRAEKRSPLASTRAETARNGSGALGTVVTTAEEQDVADRFVDQRHQQGTA
jgi:predicted SAM-dependent methyltransferase